MAAIAAPVITPASSFVLNWTAPAQPAGVVVAGFVISYGPTTALGQYLTIKDSAARSTVFKNLAKGAWYFQIRAYTAAGKDSAGSALYEVAI
jgi:hypothetical protein